MPRTPKTTNPTLDLSPWDPSDHDQVTQMIPPRRIAEGYLHRYVAGVYDFELFDMAKETRHNILMPGPTGAGKTTAARAYAAERGVPFVAVEMQGGFDFATVVGSTRADEKTGLPRFKRGELTLAIQGPSVILIDECNFAPPRFTAAFHGCLDARQSLYVHEIGQRINKHPECVIFAAYNDGYAGVVRLNEAFLNRFAIPVPWGYSDEVEEALVGPYSPRLLTLVRSLRAEPAIHTDIGTNAMEEFITFASMSGVELASHLFVNRFPEAERVIVGRAIESLKAVIGREIDAATGTLAEADVR